MTFSDQTCDYLEGGKEGVRQAARVLDKFADTRELGVTPIEVDDIRRLADAIRALAERGQVFGRGQ